MSKNIEINVKVFGKEIECELLSKTTRRLEKYAMLEIEHGGFKYALIDRAKSETIVLLKSDTIREIQIGGCILYLLDEPTSKQYIVWFDDDDDLLVSQPIYGILGKYKNYIRVSILDKDSGEIESRFIKSPKEEPNLNLYKATDLFNFKDKTGAIIEAASDKPSYRLISKDGVDFGDEFESWEFLEDNNLIVIDLIHKLGYKRCINLTDFSSTAEYKKIEAYKYNHEDSDGNIKINYLVASDGCYTYLYSLQNGMVTWFGHDLIPIDYDNAAVQSEGGNTYRIIHMADGKFLNIQ